MNERLALLCLAAAMLSVSINSNAAPPTCAAASGAFVPTVAELYTSEGCDSCPPADRWFSSLKDEAAKGKVIPLAFHVDYWDYLGWKDRFADPLFSARHRDAASQGGAKVVYTPQVLVDGREFQQWRRTGAERIATTVGQKPPRAELRVTAAPAGSQLQVSVTGKNTTGGRGAEAYVALFESGLSSDVRAGENKGVMLHHDFVVRRWLGPFAFDGANLKVSQQIEVPAESSLARSGIAVIATDERGGILQALALPLRECGG
ncbi:MAG: DUF1223 domain-containing protein [Casimicrobiaceae bacterium]